MRVFAMGMANKHDGNDINNNIKTIKFSSGRVDFWMLYRSTKMINGDGRALVLHSGFICSTGRQREPEDSWHRSAFDSWIHIIILYRYPRTLCGITLKHG